MKKAFAILLALLMIMVDYQSQAEVRMRLDYIDS